MINKKIYSFKIVYIDGPNKYDVYLITEFGKFVDYRHNVSFIQRCKDLAERANSSDLQLSLDLGE